MKLHFATTSKMQMHDSRQTLTQKKDYFTHNSRNKLNSAAEQREGNTIMNAHNWETKNSWNTRV